MAANFLTVLGACAVRAARQDPHPALRPSPGQPWGACAVHAAHGTLCVASPETPAQYPSLHPMQSAEQALPEGCLCPSPLAKESPDCLLSEQGSLSMCPGTSSKRKNKELSGRFQVNTRDLVSVSRPSFPLQCSADILPRTWESSAGTRTPDASESSSGASGQGTRCPLVGWCAPLCWLNRKPQKHCKAGYNLKSWDMTPSQSNSVSPWESFPLASSNQGL